MSPSRNQLASRAVNDPSFHQWKTSCASTVADDDCTIVRSPAAPPCMKASGTSVARNGPGRLNGAFSSAISRSMIASTGTSSVAATGGVATRTSESPTTSVRVSKGPNAKYSTGDATSAGTSTRPSTEGHGVTAAHPGGSSNSTPRAAPPPGTSMRGNRLVERITARSGEIRLLASARSCVFAPGGKKVGSMV